MIRILCLHNAKERPSYRYRIGIFLPFWRDYGIDMQTLCISGPGFLNIFRFLSRLKSYDYVLLQKKIIPKAITSFITRRTRLVYDFDDALYTRESGKNDVRKKKRRHIVDNLDFILKHASLVFAGSGELADYANALNGSVYLVPTGLAVHIPEPSPPAEKEKITIGWIGSNINLFYLRIIDEVLYRIQKKYPETRFSLMSGKRPESLKTDWEFATWSPDTEIRWLQTIDIGIMPLANDPWSRGKCAFKLLQYMSFGKPVVASNVGANREAVSNGVNGFLANTDAEWMDAIERLVLDRSLRISMGKESYKIFCERFERSRIQQQIADIIHHDFLKRKA